MLEHILGSKAKIRILREICKNPNREFTVDDISRTAGIPYGTAHPAVHELIRSRILHSKRVGHSTVFSFNSEHVLAPKVLELLDREQNAYIDIAKEFANKVGKKNIKNIILFGSVARKEVLEAGDIDILLIHKEGYQREDADRTVQDIMDRYDVLLSPLFLSVSEVKDKIGKFDNFILTVMREGMVLYGDDKWLKK